MWGSISPRREIRECVSRIINSPLPQTGMPRIAGISRGKPTSPDGHVSPLLDVINRSEPADGVHWPSEPRFDNVNAVHKLWTHLHIEIIGALLSISIWLNL